VYIDVFVIVFPQLRKGTQNSINIVLQRIPPGNFWSTISWGTRICVYSAKTLESNTVTKLCVQALHDLLHTHNRLTATRISGSLSPRRGASSGCGWRNGLRMWSVAANILNKQSQITDSGWSSSLGVGRGANNCSPLNVSMLRNIS